MSALLIPLRHSWQLHAISGLKPAVSKLFTFYCPRPGISWTISGSLRSTMANTFLAIQFLQRRSTQPNKRRRFSCIFLTYLSYPKRFPDLFVLDFIQFHTRPPQNFLLQHDGSLILYSEFLWQINILQEGG